LFSKEQWLDAGRSRQRFATSIPAGPTRVRIANENRVKGLGLPADRRTNRIAQQGGPVAPLGHRSKRSAAVTVGAGSMLRADAARA
jgi:hypothetical protein